MTLRTAPAIARIRHLMMFAAMSYALNPTYRRQIDAEEFAVSAFYEAQRKGLVERLKPRAEWLDWPTDNGGKQ